MVCFWGASSNGLWIVDVVRVATRLDGGCGGFRFLLWFVRFWLRVGVGPVCVVLVEPRLGWFNTRCAYTHSASDRYKLCSVDPKRLPRHSSAVQLIDVPKMQRCARFATMCPRSNVVSPTNQAQEGPTDPSTASYVKRLVSQRLRKGGLPRHQGRGRCRTFH